MVKFAKTKDQAAQAVLSTHLSISLVVWASCLYLPDQIYFFQQQFS